MPTCVVRLRPHLSIILGSSGYQVDNDDSDDDNDESNDGDDDDDDRSPDHTSECRFFPDNMEPNFPDVPYVSQSHVLPGRLGTPIFLHMSCYLRIT